MNDSKPRYKFSILTVVIIFVLIYLAELGLGAGVFFNFILPQIKSFQESKLTPKISQNLVSKQVTIYTLLKQNKLDEASKEAQLMFNQSQTQTEKALSMQVIGEVLAAQNNYQQAKTYFTNALNLNSGLPGAYIGLAEANIIEKDFKQAIANAQKAINITPGRPDFYDVLGLAYYGNGDKDKAIKNIEQAIKVNPNVEQYKKDLSLVKGSNIQPTSTQIKTNTTIQSTDSRGYTQADMKSWQNELSYIDQDTSNIPHFLGNSSYDQDKLNQMSTLLNQRKALANQIYTKMVNNQTLTAQDEQAINTYTQITSQYAALAKQVFPGQ